MFPDMNPISFPGTQFFSVFSIIFPILFLLVTGIIVFVFAKVLGQMNRDRKAPRLTVDATIVDKRQHVSHHHAADMHHHSFESCYITFQVESGDRMELYVPYNQFGLLIVGDHGKLTFQGTRFVQFDRM